MDPALRDAYAAESSRAFRRGATAYCALAALFILATIPLDRVRFPELAATLLPIRVAGVLGLGVILVLLQTALGVRHPRVLGMLVPLAGAATVLVLVVRTGGAASPVNVSMNFIPLGMALIMSWSAGWSALACALIVGGYVCTMTV